MYGEMERVRKRLREGKREKIEEGYWKRTREGEIEEGVR